MRLGDERCARRASRAGSVADGESGFATGSAQNPTEFFFSGTRGDGSYVIPLGLCTIPVEIDEQVSPAEEFNVLDMGVSCGNLSLKASGLCTVINAGRGDCRGNEFDCLSLVSACEGVCGDLVTP